MNGAFRSSWLIGAWVVAVAALVDASVAMGANLSTTALLVALSIAPVIVMALLARSEPSPSVAQILYSVETKNRP